MDDFNALENLRILANNIASDTSTTEPETEDIPVEVVDKGFPSYAWTPEGETVNVIADDTEGNPVRAGNSGNHRIDFNALTEKVDADPDSEAQVLDECLFKGMNFKKSKNEAFAKLECDNGCKVIFDPGMVVKPTHGGKSIFIVKCNDGDMITCAKPTNIEADMACGGTDGCWPQFHFQQDDIEPIGVDLATIAMLADIVAHNDSVSCCADDQCCADNQCCHDDNCCMPENYEKMRQMMEDIYGKIPEEQLVPINKFGIPEQPEPEKPKFNFDEPQGYFAQ